MKKQSSAKPNTFFPGLFKDLTSSVQGKQDASKHSRSCAMCNVTCDKYLQQIFAMNNI